jgi:ferredoxin-like protein FixX
LPNNSVRRSCQGHLGKRLEDKFKLREGRDPQVYGLGIKELWEIKPEKHQPGLVMHIADWPLETNHEENQPCHLTLKDPEIPIGVNLPEYDAPEQRYCPAGVYEIFRDADGGNPHLKINAQNCAHCNTCDIKDPTQNIVWLALQSGEGPVYPNM